jgi:hypothetical protein
MTTELYYNLLYGWMGLAVIIFPVLLKITVPYGRHTTKTWGPVLPNKWGWFIMEIPVLLLFSWFFFTGSAEKTIPVFIFYIAFMIHYFNRVFIFPFRMKDNGKQMPWLIVIFGLFFNFANSFFNGYWFGTLCDGLYPASWLKDPRFISGAVLFLAGMYINITSDNTLLNLRKGGKKGYFIPQGKLFNYVSSPNLLGEIIEWIGWALMSWALAPFSFALWTMANLIPRAIDHHRWYRKTFSDYPENRKAVIPFII